MQGQAVSGDYNGDGKDDIAVFYECNNTTKIILWHSDGSTFWYHGFVCNTPTLYSSQIIKAVSDDYNSDGVDDIAVLYNYGYTTKVFLWHAEGSMFWYHGPVCNTPTFYASPIIDITSGDYNNDGVSDIAVLYDYGTVKIIMWHAENSMFWYHGVVCNTPTLYASPIKGITSGDYNGDGIDDIAALYDCGATTRVIMWHSDGSTFWYNGYVCDNPEEIDPNLILDIIGGDFNGYGKDGVATFYNNDGILQLHLWL